MEKKIFIPEPFKNEMMFYKPINYENVEDQEMIEDTRSFVLKYTEICFDHCIDLNKVYFQNYEKNCLNKCMQHNFEAFNKFFKD